MNEQKLNEWLRSRKALRGQRNAASLFEALRKGDRTALSIACSDGRGERRTGLLR